MNGVVETWMLVAIAGALLLVVAIGYGALMWGIWRLFLPPPHAGAPPAEKPDDQADKVEHPELTTKTRTCARTRLISNRSSQARAARRQKQAAGR